MWPNDNEFAATKAIRHSLSKLGTNINELSTNKVHVAPQKEVIISPEMARKETDDDFEQKTTVTEEYTSYTEVHATETQTETEKKNIEIPKTDDRRKA